MGKALLKAKADNGLPADDNSLLYIILQIFGLGLVNYCIMQNDINTIALKKTV